MNLLNQEESLIQRVLSNLFPPRLGEIDDLTETHDYSYRMSRTGVDNVPGMAVGRVAEVKQRKIFYLPGLTV